MSSSVLPTQDSAVLDLSVAEQYQRDGFILKPAVLTPERCRELKETGQQVIRDHAPPGSSVFVGVAAAHFLFRELASEPVVLQILNEILPGGVDFLSDKFVFKSGAHRFATPWHCDVAYWSGTRAKISVWIPLDDVYAGNGTLKVLPGGHLRDWEHGSTGGRGTNGEFDQTIRGLPFDASGEMICEMPAGSMLFFSDRLPHASTANTSGTDRYAIISTYHATGFEEPFDRHFPARHCVIPAK